MYQKVVVIGNLGADPEEKTLQSGTKIAKFRIAMSKKRKEDTRTEWFSCVCYDKTAEIALKYLKKGDRALVEGEIWTREVVKDDGTKVRYSDLEVRDLRLMGGGSGGQPKGEKFSGVQPAAQAEGEDDLPF